MMFKRPGKTLHLFVSLACGYSISYIYGLQQPLAYRNRPKNGLVAERSQIANKDVGRRAVLVLPGLILGTLCSPDNASAKYGASSSMELPNYIDYLIEKNNAGNSKGALYKGADPAVLLRRLEEANSRLKEVEALVEKKKWSQVQGLLTGPLGTLSQTLNQIATPDSPKEVQAASKKLKSDLIAIGQAASQKNGDACNTKAKLASQDLLSFLEIAFE